MKLFQLLRNIRRILEKPNYSYEFVDKRLNPALIKLEKIVCENTDKELFENFLEMIVATYGSANETPDDILGGIFICQSYLVAIELKGKYNNQDLIDALKFGFDNRTFEIKDRTSNYSEL